MLLILMYLLLSQQVTFAWMDDKDQSFSAFFSDKCTNGYVLEMFSTRGLKHALVTWEETKTIIKQNTALPPHKNEHSDSSRSASKHWPVSRQTQRLCFKVACFLNLWQAQKFGIGKQHFIVNFWHRSRKWLSRMKREPTQSRVLLMWAWSRPHWKACFIHYLLMWQLWWQAGSHSRADGVLHNLYKFILNQKLMA